MALFGTTSNIDKATNTTTGADKAQVNKQTTQTGQTGVSRQLTDQDIEALRRIVGDLGLDATTVRQFAGNTGDAIRSTFDARAAAEKLNFDRETMGAINQQASNMGSKFNSGYLELVQRGREDLATRLASLGAQVAGEAQSAQLRALSLLPQFATSAAQASSVLKGGVVSQDTQTTANAQSAEQSMQTVDEWSNVAANERQKRGVVDMLLSLF